jgi:NTE family protein
VLGDAGLLAAEAMASVDVMALMELFALWEKLPDASAASLALVGEAAKVAKTMDPARFRELLEPEVPDAWPSTKFLATAVDADTGEFVVLSAASGVSLVDAVASSICVPGIFPPVAVADRLLVDGGLRSGTSADLAAGYDTVIVLAPIGSRMDGMDPAAGRAAADEVRALEAAGASCTLLFPDDATNDVIGINRMDATISVNVMAAGRRQGRTLAASLSGFSISPADR